MRAATVWFVVCAVLAAADPAPSPADQRAALVAAATTGDLAAATRMVRLAMWDDMARLPVDAPALRAWRDQDKPIDGLHPAQVYGEVLANSAVRHEADLGHDAMLARMAEARDLLLAHPIEHPIVAREAAWLCRDTRRARDATVRDLERTAARLLAADPPTDDPLAAGRWLLERAEAIGGEVKACDDRYEQALDAAEATRDETLIGDAASAWAKKRAGWLSVDAFRTALDLDAQEVVRLYQRCLEARIASGDRRGQAMACLASARFVRAQGMPAPAAAMGFATAAEAAADAGDHLTEAVALCEQLETELAHPDFDEDRPKRLRETAERAVAVARPVGDLELLARCLDAQGRAAERGSDAAVTAYAEAVDVAERGGRPHVIGEWLLALARALDERASALRGAGIVDDGAARAVSVRERAVALLADAPPTAAIADARCAVAFAHLAAATDAAARDAAIAEVESGADCRRACGDDEVGDATLEDLARALADAGDVERAHALWKRVADACAARGRDGGRAGSPRGRGEWLHHAAELYRLAGVADPPVVDVVIDPSLDRTQGRDAEGVSRLVAAFADARGADASRAALTALLTAMGSQSPDADWRMSLDGIWPTDWRLSTDDCRALLRNWRGTSDSIETITVLITRLGSDAACTSLADAALALDDPADRKANDPDLFVGYLLQRVPAQAKRLLPYALAEPTESAIAAAARLLDGEELRLALLAAVASPDWPAQTAALRLLNREPESVPAATRAAIVLKDEMQPWGPPMEALHGLVLMGGEVAEDTIRRELERHDGYREVRHVAILGAGFLGLRACAPALRAIAGGDDEWDAATAALALNAIGDEPRLDLLRRWATTVADDDERAYVARAGLIDDQPEAATAWLERSLTEGRRFADLYVIQALGWTRSERAAALLVRLVVDHRFGDGWYAADGSNRDFLRRSLSRLPLSDEQAAAAERTLGIWIPQRACEPSAPDAKAVDDGPVAPLLRRRVP